MYLYLQGSHPTRSLPVYWPPHSNQCEWFDFSHSPHSHTLLSFLANRADLHDIFQRKIGIGKSDLHTGRLILSQLFLKRKGFPAAPPHGSTVRLRILHRYHLRPMQVEKSACNTPNLMTLEPLFSLLFLCTLILSWFSFYHNDMNGNILFPCEKVRVLIKKPHFCVDKIHFTFLLGLGILVRTTNNM